MPTRPAAGSVSTTVGAMVARTTPAVLELLADGVARPQAAIIAALADRHSRDEVRCTLMRLAVTGQLVEQGRRFGLSPSNRTDQE